MFGSLFRGDHVVSLISMWIILLNISLKDTDTCIVLYTHTHWSSDVMYISLCLVWKYVLQPSVGQLQGD